MAKSRDSAKFGYSKSPALKLTKAGLQIASDQAFQIPAKSSHPMSKAADLGNLAAPLMASSAQNKSPLNCRQNLCFSCLFDGRDNNLDADLGMWRNEGENGCMSPCISLTNSSHIHWL
jgi:hypothetical protein